MAHPAISSARFVAACRVLSEVLIFSSPADSVLSRWFRENPKTGSQDRAFIAESVFGVLRRLRTLRELGAGSSPRRLVLAFWFRYQGIKLDVLLPYAKEDDDWLTGLRGFDSSAWTPAVKAEWPDWLWDKLAEQYSEEKLLELARALQNSAGLDLRVNTQKMKRDTALESLGQEGIVATATPYSPLGLRLVDKLALNRHPLFLNGCLEVQDEGSQLLGLLVAPKRGEMIVDFCAGAGGKTLLLGNLMASTGRLYAFDVSEKRLSNFKPRLKRSGLSNVHPVLIAHESDTKVKRLAGKIDRVLVDAPCSGLGTLRRNPDLKWRQTPEAVAELLVKQASILDAASKLVKVGGRLVYATCSLLADENSRQVDQFLAQHPEFVVVSAAEELARQGIALDTGAYLELNPAIHGTDGFFAAIFERQA